LPFLSIVFLFMGSSSPLDMYVDERTKTEIFFSSQDTIFPKHWYGGRINAEAEPLSRLERLRVINILNRGFEKYPDLVIRENIDRVYALKKMRFYGVPFGGTNVRNTLYICDDEDNPLFTNPYIEAIFHHEFSSVLKRTYSWFFDYEAWESVNPPDFSYGNGGVNAIMNGEASLKLNPDYYAMGFLTRYSQASLEEDVNVFAQNLFSGDPTFWAVVDQNTRIRRKSRILIGFYQKIDPRFNETYFRKMADCFVKR